MNSEPISHQEFLLAISDLSDENLQSLKTQLTKSINQLVSTNAELNREMSSPSATTEDINLYRECIQENHKVIYDQTRRALSLVDELHGRGVLSEGAKEMESKVITALAAPEQDSSVYL